MTAAGQGEWTGCLTSPDVVEVRQARRTQLTDATTAALFVLNALDPLTDTGLAAAADALVAHLRPLGPAVRVAQRLVGQP